MRMAYLVMAHHDRPALERLLRRLIPVGSPDVAIVHADARSALWSDLNARPLDLPGRIFALPDPVAVRWGHWSQVEADRRLVDAALMEGCDIAHIISGVDWPAVSREQMLADIAGAGNGTCFIEAVPGEIEERMQERRLDSRWLRVDPHRDRLAYAVTWELRRASRLVDRVCSLAGRERSRPFGPWHKGSSWWSLPVAALEVVSRELYSLKRDGRMIGTVCADEHVVQTIVASRFPNKLAPNHRFVDFEPGASSPRLLGSEDLPAIRASGAWFMRKVDAAHDPFFVPLP